VAWRGARGACSEREARMRPASRSLRPLARRATAWATEGRGLPALAVHGVRGGTGTRLGTAGRRRMRLRYVRALGAALRRPQALAGVPGGGVGCFLRAPGTAVLVLASLGGGACRCAMYGRSAPLSARRSPRLVCLAVAWDAFRAPQGQQYLFWHRWAAADRCAMSGRLAPLSARRRPWLVCMAVAWDAFGAPQGLQ